MKRLTTLFLASTICLSIFSQGKITPKARLMMNRQKAKTEAQILVVKIDKKNAAKTYDALRAAGATIKSKIGSQSVINIPIDSIAVIERIEGVKRIDTGHKPKYKSDISRQVSGTCLLNGPTVSDSLPKYTGKGVTICVIDAGFDFQHPAFKDSLGNSRIKAVYLIGETDGHPFTVNDPEAGEITYPGSVYDTPELIAKLTTDMPDEYHGTHTASIAAGSLSPMGFGGMAPEADIVLIPLSDEQIEKSGIEDEYEFLETALSFASAYAQQDSQPTVLSMSANDHSGPHDGTSSMSEAIEAASEHLIPIFSAGNEGGYPIHLYRKFTEDKPSVKSTLVFMEEDGGGYSISDEVNGYTRTGDEVSIQLGFVSINMFTGRTTSVWTSETATAKTGNDDVTIEIDSEQDNQLSQYFNGNILLSAQDEGNGKLHISATIDGYISKLGTFTIIVSGSPNTEVDLWDSLAGFNIFEFSNYAMGDSEISAGDWTSTSKVISVGAYCTNKEYRSYDGSEEEESDFKFTVGDYAPFSSYGTMLNDVTQPVISAPGVNIVSAFNHYACDMPSALEGMVWQGFPYGAESGTSMSCPAVSGIVALWLQAKPDMTLDDIKKVMQESSVNDNYTMNEPIRWGYGKINAARGIEYILTGTVGINDMDNRHAQRNIIYDLQGRQIKKPTRGLYIRNGKKFVY